MMTCDRIRERFSDYLDGELLEAEQPALEGHLASCAACREEWGRFRATVDAVRTLPQHVAPRDIADAVRDQLERSRLLEAPATHSHPRVSRWRKPLFACAAAAAVLVLVRAGFEQREARAPESGLAPSGDASAAFGRKGREFTGTWQEPATSSVEAEAALPPAPETAPVVAPAPVSVFAMGGDPAPAMDEAGLKAPSQTAAPVSPVERGGPLVAWVMPSKDAGADAMRLREALGPVSAEVPAEGSGGGASRVLRFRVRASQVAEAGRLLEALGARASESEAVEAKVPISPPVPSEAPRPPVVDRETFRDCDGAVSGDAVGPAEPPRERESLRALKRSEHAWGRVHGGLRDDNQEGQGRNAAQADSEASKGKLVASGGSEIRDALETEKDKGNDAEAPQEERLSNDAREASPSEAAGGKESEDWVVLEITLTEPTSEVPSP